VVSVIELIIKGVQTRLLYRPLVEYEGYIPVDYIAAALDPRTLDLHLLPNHEAELVWKHINNLVEKMSKSNNSAQQSPLLSSKYGSDYDILLKSPAAPLATRRPRSALYTVEVNQYMNCKGCEMFQDPLSWWSFNSMVYPHLAKLAREYLALPASSATVERLFSRAGSVLLFNKNTSTAFLFSLGNDCSPDEIEQPKFASTDSISWK
jgi:hypothetical protein